MKAHEIGGARRSQGEPGGTGGGARGGPCRARGISSRETQGDIVTRKTNLPKVSYLQSLDSNLISKQPRQDEVKQLLDKQYAFLNVHLHCKAKLTYLAHRPGLP